MAPVSQRGGTQVHMTNENGHYKNSRDGAGVSHTPAEVGETDTSCVFCWYFSKCMLIAAVEAPTVSTITRRCFRSL